ncbi:MAG: TraR/DksA C4-type zinc finger protein [Candidatus Brocadia sp.]|jgi:DnaK suppressor protein|uniref:DNA-binding protein n=1 Tax=Candidatus Brocadia fulgida TaxID=380242 RepID=A0A0M2UT42_9BACT|nr:MAG: DNA-binding protein [Candidatus Brocadia fulgida]MBV6519066.1 RNA polymerase-binding transcription factor DksA [Candidatus Brocadia fulgida]MCC6324117.1 TraR/DksA C4-type zinc finger protein [Candidatus Brocadia sp.]UJS19895.1 MAG: TraR/DksA C4-type zinc finger protein [Candidatus Brocadia sp.]
MQKKELKQIENLLKSRKNILLKEFEKRAKKYRDAGSEKATDVVEIASSSSSEVLEFAVAEEGARELKQIEDALSRIKTGQYGVCEQCGKVIKKARLKAIPFATLCVSCKEEEEKACDDRAFRERAEEIADRPENVETDDMDTLHVGKKIMELEYDDNRN